MSIKYWKLTIIYDKEQTILISLLNWLKNEEYTGKKSKYIFIFDDGEICDSEDRLTKKSNIFFVNVQISFLILIKDNHKDYNLL